MIIIIIITIKSWGTGPHRMIGSNFVIVLRKIFSQTDNVRPAAWSWLTADWQVIYFGPVVVEAFT